MAFPNTIRSDLAVGFVGDLAFDGPHKGAAYVLNSADAANNVIGRAFTWSADGVARAGGAGAFMGILANRAEYTTAGTAAGGALAPTTTLRNGEVGDFVRQCAGIFVDLASAFAVGYYVVYNTTTGVLDSVPLGTDVPAGFALVPGGSVIRYGSGTAGLAVIALSDDLPPHVGGA